jgi:ankyrin repeat protein
MRLSTDQMYNDLVTAVLEEDIPAMDDLINKLFRRNPFEPKVPIQCFLMNHIHTKETLSVLTRYGLNPKNFDRHMIYQIEKVNTVISSGADVNARPHEYNAIYRENDSCTALMMAVQNQTIDIVQKLLSAGANPHEKNSDGQRALMMAAEGGDANILNLLLNYVN